MHQLFVNTHTNRCRVRIRSWISLEGGGGSMLADHFLRSCIQLCGGDPWADQLPYCIECPGIDATCFAQGGNLLRAFNNDIAFPTHSFPFLCIAVIKSIVTCSIALVPSTSAKIPRCW